MFQSINYNNLLREGKKLFLIDTRLAGMKARQVEELTTTLGEIIRLLQELQFTPSCDNIEKVAALGSDGLQAVVLAGIEEKIGRNDLPTFVADAWRKGARQAVPSDFWRKADTLSADYHRAVDGLPFEWNEDIKVTDNGELQINNEVINERIRQGCKLQVTDSQVKEAEELLKIGKEIKALELQGLNAMELLQQIIKADATPDTFTLYKGVATRRHQPGQITPPNVMGIIGQAQAFARAFASATAPTK